MSTSNPVSEFVKTIIASREHRRYLAKQEKPNFFGDLNSFLFGLAFFSFGLAAIVHFFGPFV